jgi:hypothetical protein
MKIEDAKWAKIEKFEKFESEMIKSLKVLYISQSNLNLSWIIRAKPLTLPFVSLSISQRSKRFTLNHPSFGHSGRNYLDLVTLSLWHNG